MTSTPDNILTAEEYLQFEENSRNKHEFVSGSIFAMAGASAAHNLICSNIVAYLHLKLNGTDCQVYGSDMKLHIASRDSFYYPDIMVHCETFNPELNAIERPSLVFEVLSPSTDQTDKREKLAAYKTVSTLLEYAVVFQNQKRIDLHRRSIEQRWETITFIGSDNLLLNSLPCGEMAVPLDKIYGRFSPPGRVKESVEEYAAGFIIDTTT